MSKTTIIDSPGMIQVDLAPAPLVAEQEDSRQLVSVIERAAGNPSIDVDKMERLLAMHERITARNAEVAFNTAMTLAQQEMPRVKRDARNTHTQSLYTRLESLNEEAVPVYTKHGFSLSFGTADCPTPGYFRVTCLVAHKSGHSRPYQCDLPIDDTGAKGLPTKTKMHGAGSTFSYGRRYLTLLIFNISLVNEDDDGNRGRTPKPAGPSSLAGDKAPSADDSANKRKLVDLLRAKCIPGVKGYHLDEAARGAIEQWLIDEAIIADTEHLADLAGETLTKAVAAVERKLNR